MQSKTLPLLASARLLVGALGERQGWWATKVTEPMARRYLERLFPRTAARAALETVSLAAQREHDQRLRADHWHLFRLPPELEDRLDLHLSRVELSWPPESEEALQDALTELAGAPQIAAEGPRLVGSRGQLQHAATIRQIVGLYVDAATRELRIWPYAEERP